MGEQRQDETGEMHSYDSWRIVRLEFCMILGDETAKHVFYLFVLPVSGVYFLGGARKVS